MRDVAGQYGYRHMRVPLVEATPLFVRAIGEVTDVVEKEMYTFEDRLNGESLTLRPEATAGIVRAAIEHNLHLRAPAARVDRGPMFRHERPQKGRYRQFHQFDAEALGFDGPDVDAEQIVMLHAPVAQSGARRHRPAHSIPSATPRNAGRIAPKLVEYFSTHAATLDADSQRRLHTNPLRILDSKNPALQPLIAGAPRLLDRLGSATRGAFRRPAAVARRPGHRVHASTRAWCAGSTTTTAPCSSG